MHNLFSQLPLISQLCQHYFGKRKNYTLGNRHYLPLCFPAMFACVKLFSLKMLFYIICASCVSASLHPSVYVSAFA